MPNAKKSNKPSPACDQKLVTKALALAHVRKVLHPKWLRSFASKLRANAPSKGDWVDVATDVKSSAGMDELAMARSALASVYGSRPVPFRLCFSLTFTTVGGVLSTGGTILISSAPEFASLQALFDEWRPENGHLDFTAQYSAVPVLTGTNCALAIGFDPMDGTLPTTVREVAELKQHQLYRPVMEIGPTGTVVSTSFRTAGDATMLRFPYTMRGVDAESSTAAGLVEVTNGWRATKSTGGQANLLIGYIKSYAESASPAAGVALAGIFYHNIKLRSRT